MSEAKGQVVNFDIELKQFNDKPIFMDKENTEKSTLRRVCVEALLSNDSSGNNDATAKLKQFELARKVHNSNGQGIELTSEECQMILKCSNSTYTANIYGRICECIK